MVLGSHLNQASVMTRELGLHLRASAPEVEAVSVEVRDGVERLTKHMAGAVPDHATLGHHAFMVQRSQHADGAAGVIWHANTPGVERGIYNLRSEGFTPWTQIGGDPSVPGASHLMVDEA